ncbi:TetR/AcrR family transcriptional regulator [Nesterenkonia populi]
MTASASGRPRASGESLTGRGTREDILAASAELFCTKGFAGTSTHAIAKTAGIRQASLYHYFGNKSAILLELLLGTVRPSVEVASALAPVHEKFSPVSRLWALCVSDAKLLSAGSQNIGALYLLPELEDPAFEGFHQLRAQLERHYCGLIRDAGLGEGESGEAAMLALALVESIILRRRRQPHIPAEQAEVIATSVLRMLGAGASDIEHAQREGADVLRELGI